MNQLATSINTALRGAGGGGSDAARTPIEAPDSLRSISYAQVLDLIGEGEIYGFADQANPLSCVYLNETPLANSDGSLNFKNVSVDSRVGTQTQDFIPGFDGIANETAVGTELKFDTPWVHSFTNMNVNALRVRISTPAMLETNTTNGDRNGSSVRYAIDIRVDNGEWVTKLNAGITGKASDKYERTHKLDLPPAATSWDMRVRRLTADSTVQAIQNKTFIESYSEIIYAKLRMPMSALVAVILDAEQFNNIPSRAYHIKGRIIRIPSNYDPDTRTYTGLWDGTFKIGYSNNPAWCFYDMVLNTRYGLGNLVQPQLIDKWTLYQIAQYCDQLVDDGFGGKEPRFTCNLVLQKGGDALRVMQDMATVFRGVLYATGNTITASADMPSDPVYNYNPSNVIDGKFTYSGSSKTVRHTAAFVSWNDPSDFYRAKSEYVDDPDGIIRYGYQPIEVAAVGCTSRGQARRWGKYLIVTERYETNAANWGVGLDGTVVAPGKIVTVADPLYAGKRIGGRIRSATFNSVTVDLMPEVVPGDRLIVTLPAGVSQTRVVASTAGNTITVTVAFDAIPLPQSVWAVESDEIALQTYRVLSVKELNGKTRGYTINAIQHVPGKFAFIDEGLMIQEPPVSQLPPKVVPSPTGLAVESRDVADQNTSIKVVTASWIPVAVATTYELLWRQSNGSWTAIRNIGTYSVDIYGIQPGGFELQVTAIDANGLRSQPTYGGPYDVPAVATPPGFVAEIDNTLDVMNTAMADLGTQADELRTDVDATLAQVQVLQGQVGDILQADEWVGTKSYPLGDLVQLTGKLYRSLIADNLNHQPSGATDAYWEYIGNYASLGDAVAANAANVAVLNNTVTQQGNSITANSQAIAQNAAAIGNKADASALTATNATVSQQGNTLTAQGQTINSITARLPAGTGVLATGAALNSTNVTVANQGGQISANQQAITAVQGSVGDVNSRVDNEIVARQSGDAANATAITAVTAGLVGGGNLLTNSRFDTMQAWQPLDGSGGWAAGLNVAGQAWQPYGVNTLGGMNPGTPTAYFTFQQLIEGIVGGASYIYSSLFQAHRCRAILEIQWLDFSGNNILLSSPIDSYDPGAGGTSPGGQDMSNWLQLKGKVTPPANTRRALVRLTAIANGGANPYIWWLHPMFEKVSAAQTLPSPWSPGGNEASSVTTAITASAGPGGAYAQATTMLDVNGHITGVRQTNNGATGDFIILTDKFGIVAPNGGARTEYSNGNWRVYDAAGTLRVSMGVNI